MNPLKPIHMRQIEISGSKVSLFGTFRILTQCLSRKSIQFSLLGIVCNKVPCGLSTHAVDGYLSVLIMQNEQTQEREDEWKR